MSIARNCKPPTDLLDAGPPRDECAERAVLASIVIDPRIIGDVAALLAPDRFYDPRHEAIYSAMLRLHQRGIPCDATLLVGALDGVGHLDRSGHGEWVSIGYLERLLHDLLPSAAHWRHYADRVVEVSRRRRSYYRGIRLLGAAGRADPPGTAKQKQRAGVRF
jgi:replicative DNA helicase